MLADAEGGWNLEDALHDDDNNPASALPDYQPSPDLVGRQRRPVRDNGRAYQSVGGAFAVDLLGFGASERREDLLPPRAMGEFLAQLIAGADRGTPRIVAPDAATTAAPFAAATRPNQPDASRRVFGGRRGTPDADPGRGPWARGTAEPACPARLQEGLLCQSM